jgi:uncharacterized OB-fold protein
MPAPSFAPPDTELTRPFWQGVEAGELRLPRCAICRQWMWYPDSDATHCGAPLEWVAVAPHGSIFTFTVVRRPFLPGATKADVPFTTILVELDEAPGVRLVGLLRDGIEPHIGMRVTAVFPDRDGRRAIEFEPAGRE